MRTPTSLLNRPGRAAAVVGAVLAVSAGATVAFVASASADEPGRCIQNVNVREKPDVNSRIVALCEAGTQVQVAETRDGFVHLTNLHGWAAQQYVSVNGRTPAPAPATERSGSRTAPGNESGRAPADESRPRESGSNAGDRHGSGGGSGSGNSGGGNTGGSGSSGNEGSDAGDSGSNGTNNESGHNEDHGGGVGGGLLG